MSKKYFVYMFLNKEEKPIYIGKTNDLNTRFRDHKDERPDMWEEHEKIIFNTFEEECDQIAYEKLMIMKHSPKYNGTNNYNSNIQIIDTESDGWKEFDELVLKNSFISANKSSIKASKRKDSTSSKFYDTLWIRKEDGCLKISGNGTLKLEENEFEDLIEEMMILLKEGVYASSEFRQEMG